MECLGAFHQVQSNTVLVNRHQVPSQRRGGQALALAPAEAGNIPPLALEASVCTQRDPQRLQPSDEPSLAGDRELLFVLHKK